MTYKAVKRPQTYWTKQTYRKSLNN